MILEKTQVNNTPPQVDMKSKRGRKAGAITFPKNSLMDALKIPQTIWDKNSGQPMSLLDLATKTGFSVMSSGFGELLRSSSRYGLTDGSWSQTATKTISLTALGTSIVAPVQGDDKNALLRQAFETPRIFTKILQPMNGKIIPQEDMFKTTLRRVHNIDESDVDACYASLIKNIQELGISNTNNDKLYLVLEKLSSSVPNTGTPIGDDDNLEIEEQSDVSLVKTPPVLQPEIKQIFVAHGKNKRPLEQLEKILNKFKVSYKVAIDEPHAGRPISAKVAELMKNSTSGIFIFTADEKITDQEGNEIWRPSQNVVYELGAASVLYGNKIVIFKEKDVSFASDFSDLGYISFDKDQLDAKAADLMLELINLGFMQLTPT